MTKFSEIQDIINAFQDSGKEAFGNAGYAWSSGYLGATLADLLYHHIPAIQRDIVLNNMIHYTERNRKLNEESVDNAI